jgi:myosin heavy subunit
MLLSLLIKGDSPHTEQELEVVVPKGSKLLPVNLSALKKLTDDLVKLEDINDPFIVHNLRERCKQNDIYVGYPSAASLTNSQLT